MNFFPLRNWLDLNACLYSFCDDINRFAPKCPWKFTLNVLVSEPVERVEFIIPVPPSHIRWGCVQFQLPMGQVFAVP